MKAENADKSVEIETMEQAESPMTEEEVTHTPAPQATTAPQNIRRWLRWRNVVSILLIAALIIIGYYIWQGEGVFVTGNRNQNPFDSSKVREPQDISQSIALSQSGGVSNPIILQEDFSATRGSWRFSPPNQASFFGQGLLLDDNIYDGEAWAQPGLTFDDFVLQVSSRWVGGALSGVYGVRIRKDMDTGEFLAFYLHNDGRFTIVQQNRRTLTTLANEYDSAIKTDGSINVIQIEASGDTVHFYVNNSYLGTSTVQINEAGLVEFVATKVDDTGVFKAGFDNLVITHNYIGSSNEVIEE